SGDVFVAQGYANGAATDTFSFTPTSNGTYWLSMQSLDNATGTYAVSVATSVSSPDLPASSASSAAVALNTSAGGNIDFTNDLDWFRVNLQAGVTYTARMEGAATNGGTLSDPFLVLRNNQGVYLDQNDNSGGTTNSTIVFRPTTSGN